MSTVMKTPGKNPVLDQLDFDIDALRAKYAQERDRRIRKEHNDQYIAIKGDFKHFEDDPYADPNFSRAPVNDEMDVVIVGGGHGGISAGAHLRKVGFEKIRIIDKAGNFSGTWYWNRYPGLRCDVEAYIYMPMLEDTGHVPKEKYAMGDDIRDNALKIVKKYALDRDALLQTQVVEARWNEAEQRWHVKTDRNDNIKARYLVISAGGLLRPKLPGIPGIDKYQGHTFHTSRWDYKYTGGSINGNLEKLKDKRVAVVGTGATAIQIIPHLAASAKELYVCQRTPGIAGPRCNGPTDVDWFKSQQPGWQKARQHNFTACVTGLPVKKDLVNDGWTTMVSKMAGLIPPEDMHGLSPEEFELLGEIADFQATNEVRARIDSVVKNRQAAEGLKPWFRYFCKRPTFSDEFLPVFNQPNVHLLDTQGLGVERITEKGVVVQGVEHEVDCIIFATGYEVGTDYTHRARMQIYGRNGEALKDHWKDAKAVTLHGFHSHGFPNLFHMFYQQKGVTSNVTEMIITQAEYISQLLGEMKKRNLTYVEPTAEAEKYWAAECEIGRARTQAWLSQCTPSYYNGEGDIEKGLLSNAFGRGFITYQTKLKEWFDEGNFVGVTMK